MKSFCIAIVCRYLYLPLVADKGGGGRGLAPIYEKITIGILGKG
jgi:hypothetical protein